MDKKDLKLVSVIITTHNRCDLLTRAIESVLSQTYSKLECIVVDDASEDETPEVCKRYPVIYIQIPKMESRGGNYARNMGIKTSKGEYCAFLDDDDYWLPTKIEKQVELIEKKKCELVFCGRRQEIVGKSGISYKDILPNSQYCGDMKEIILTNIITVTTCILARRQALLDVGLFDDNLRFWQEYELTIRLAQRKPFHFVNEPLAVYRVDEGDKNRLTNQYFTWRDAVKYIHKKHAPLYSELNMYERLKVQYMVWRESMRRCRKVGLRWRFYFYYTLTLIYRVIMKVMKYL